MIAGFEALVEALRVSGKPAEVAGQLRRFREAAMALPGGSAENLYRSSCVFAAAAGAGGGTAEETRRYADEAIGTLRKAKEAGFRDLDRLRGNTNLAALRDRDEYRRLVDDIRYAPAAPRVGATGGQAEAKADLERKVLAVRDMADGDHHDDPHRRAGLARSRFAIGVSQVGIGHAPQGVRTFEQVRAMQEGLVREDPEQLLYRLDLSATSFALADTHVRFGRIAAAQRAWRRAIEVLEQARLKPADGLSIERDRALADAHLQVGRGYSGLRLWREAASELAVAFRLAEPGDPDDWMHHACLLLLIGDEGAIAPSLRR